MPDSSVKNLQRSRAQGTNVPRIDYRPEFEFLPPKRARARGNVTPERVKQ
jgi:hypothetical protein